MLSAILVAVLYAIIASHVFVTETKAEAFEPREATVLTVHRAIFRDAISCRSIVQSFLDRIAAFDQAGPALNAIITTNAGALQSADELDARMNGGGFAPGMLHCIPILLKDNYDTYDMPTTAGSLSLKGSQPLADAPVVKAMRDAGAILLGKVRSNFLLLLPVSEMHT
jgi:amidase